MTSPANQYKTLHPQLFNLLLKRFGYQYIELIEDASQQALLKHLQSDAVIENNLAWLMKTASHLILDAFKRDTLHQDKLQTLFQGDALVTEDLQDDSVTTVGDKQLDTMFACVGLSQSGADVLPLVLRYLCGFSLQAIANALLLKPETVKKRLARYKAKLAGEASFVLTEAPQQQHIDAVNQVIYLMFNEGYYSSLQDQVLDKLLCQEAIGLLTLMTSTDGYNNYDSFGLLALMQFNMARIDSRTDEKGHAVALSEQRREQWSAGNIHLGKLILNQILAQNAPVSKYVIEAQIANLHCSAKDFSLTPWPQIVVLYQQLKQLESSPVLDINIAAALGYAGKAQAGIDLLEDISDSIENRYLWLATMAHLKALAGDSEAASVLAEQAKEKGGTEQQHRLMSAQLDKLSAAK